MNVALNYFKFGLAGNLSIIIEKIKNKSGHCLFSLKKTTEEFNFIFFDEPCLIFHKK